MSLPWVSILAALIGSLQFGFQIAVLNCSIDAVEQSFDISSQAKSSFVVSCVLIGALIGSMIAGNVADSKGPRSALVFCSLVYICGSLLSGMAESVQVLMLARLVSGIGVGSSSILVPRYLVEISPSEARGYVSSLNQVFICLGILLSFVMGLGYEKDPQYSVFGIQWWRWMLLLPGTCMGIVQASVMFFKCPESPAWVAKSGNEEEERFIDHGLTHDEESLFSILRSRKYRRIIRLALVIPITQQMSGINAVILYGSSIMREVLSADSSPIKANMMIGIVNLVFSTISSSLIDTIGRRPCLITSFFGMAACLFALSIAHGTVAFWSLISYVCFFGIGCGGVPWVYLSEILPGAIKKDVQGLATTGNWITNILVGSSFGFFSAAGLGFAFSLYGTLCLLSGLFCLRYMVETNQKSLSEIHKELMDPDDD